MSSIGLEDVAPHSRRADALTLDIERSKPQGGSTFATDYYEILRVGPQADAETIERVYRTLADRFHPDNPSTGDPDTFLRLREAYETLSSQANRAKYNLLCQYSGGSTRFRLQGREFFDGVRGGQNRRLALLCLLYRRRISSHESPGLTILDLEQLTGCMREEITAALWYLGEKQWATIGEYSAYSITADGFDFVESKLESRLEFRALATMSYYRLPAGRENLDTLPLDIEPAIASEGDVCVADHYEILGIRPHADEETIERVYRTLASRFHPDNPSTGDAKTFLRIQEAYDTLSDPARRAQHNALRQRSKYSERFRLRGREFFDGIRGEQLRRLAVLCLLYRQAASEWPGLTVLDLEQLTGCTREELGSGLWYLREKKWAKYGEFTEYSITAAGFDVVENKLEEREAARSQAWLIPEDTRAHEFEYPRLSAAQEAEHTQENVPLSLASENVEIAQELPQTEESPGIEQYSSPFDVDAESVGPPPENGKSQSAGMSPTDMFQHLLRLKNAGQLPDEQPAVAPERTYMEEATGIADQVTQLEASDGPLAQSQPDGPPLPRFLTAGELTDINRNRSVRGFVRRLLGFNGGAEPAAPNQENIPVTLQFPMADAVAAPENYHSHDAESERTNTDADEPSNENRGVPQKPIPIEEATGIAEQVIPFEDRAEPEEREEAPHSWAWLIPEDTHGNDSRSLVADAPIGLRNGNSPFAAIGLVYIKADQPSNENAAAEQAPARNEEKAPDISEQAIHFEPGVESVALSEEPSDENVAVTQEPVQMEEAFVSAEQDIQLEPAPGIDPEAQEAGAAQPVVESQPVAQVALQPPQVTAIINLMEPIAEHADRVPISAVKRVIFSMGGKGGVGKTSVMTGLAEWFEENRIPVTLLDLDTENKACGSLTHFFGGRVPKINIHTPAGLDAFVDHLGEDVPVILADMGAGAGHVTHDWFDTMYPDVAETGVVFTAIGVVTSDPASVESVLNWAAALEGRVDYVIVENKLIEHADFSYWQEGDQAQEFRKRFRPAIVQLDNRLADLENAARNYGVTLGRIAGRSTGAAELQKASLVMRAQSYRRRMFAEFDKVKELLLP